MCAETPDAGAHEDGASRGGHVPIPPGPISRQALRILKISGFADLDGVNIGFREGALR
jgi:hypothetical protein